MKTAQAGQRLHTVSLRRRVSVSVLVVLIGALVVSGVLVVTLFIAQSNRDARQQLVDREVVARQLERRDTPAAQIARRVSGRGVVAKITTPDGSVVGPAADLPEAAPGERRVRTVRLADGSVLTLSHNNDEHAAAQARLARLLLLVGLGTVAVTTIALLLAVGFALRPLDAMTSLATSIARGRRGTRLAPRRRDTELGRAAVAFDEMLEALEGAERSARESEARTRQFVADAAHELRTPIAGVQSAAETLLHNETDGGETRDRMTVLLIRETKRAARLVDDLLALAQIDAGLELSTRRIDLYRLASAEVDRMRLLAAQLDWRIEGAAAEVDADPDRIGQVLINLLENARRHTPDGGTVLVRVTASGGTAEVTVTDSGAGVPEADRERIFHRMVRLDDGRPRDGAATGGSGLGLAIARGVARAHGGELSCVEPETGAGACFLLRLPTGNV